MAKKKIQEPIQLSVPAFYLSVDGREFGPFSIKHEDEVKRLYRYKGIEPRHVMVRPESLVDPPKKEKRKRESEPSLLDGVDWMPTAKIRGTW